jgi:NlpE N-terminal domain
MYAAALRILVRPQLHLSLLALCFLLPSPCPGVPVDFAWRQEADLAGTYQGQAPAADAAKRVFTLNLAADGTAIFDTLYIGKDRVTQHGRWMQDGSQIVLTFDPMGPHQPPRPITFRHRDHKLSPIRWDPSEWGRAGPPVLHRARPKTTVQDGI